MSGSTFGRIFRIATWGESHGMAVGVVVDGCPAGLSLREEDVQADLDRRRPGKGPATSARQEEDRVKILSGLFEGRTTGTPISMMVMNRDAQSHHYDELRLRPRPGHADLTYQTKYGIRDHRGGGRASARETVGRVAGGAVARKLLRTEGVEVMGYVIELGGVKARLPDWTETNPGSELSSLVARAEASPLRCPDSEVEKDMLRSLEQARKEGDSLGGVVELVATGVPPGLGEPVFDKLDADLARALMSIGAVKAVEIGAGVGSSHMRGSQMNDTIIPTPEGIRFATNRSGGILGGISTGSPILCRIHIKPTPSISRPQQTVDLSTGQPVQISVRGRHDPAIPPRVVPVAEAMMALVLADHYLLHRGARI